jgi:hypothetical protein
LEVLLKLLKTTSSWGGFLITLVKIKYQFTMFRYIFIFFIFCLSPSNFSAQNAIYSLDFVSNWNNITHPTDYPAAAHWSRLVGATHNTNVSFWNFGELASQGVEDVAEDGLTAAIEQEINVAIGNGNAFEIINLPLGFGNVFTFESISVSTDFPYISLMTMLAPSPDWLAEIHNVKLTDDFGNWKDTITINVYATDAGTDNGITYMSPDSDTNPPENISSLQNILPFSDKIIASFVFELNIILNIDDVTLQNSISLYPNPTNGTVFINNLGNETLTKAEIFDITGKKIMSFDNFYDQKNIYLNSFQNGLYFLKLYSNSGSTVKKIIKK